MHITAVSNAIKISDFSLLLAFWILILRAAVAFRQRTEYVNSIAMNLRGERQRRVREWGTSTADRQRGAKLSVPHAATMTVVQQPSRASCRASLFVSLRISAVGELWPYRIFERSISYTTLLEYSKVHPSCDARNLIATALFVLIWSSKRQCTWKHLAKTWRDASREFSRVEEKFVVPRIKTQSNGGSTRPALCSDVKLTISKPVRAHVWINISRRGTKLIVARSRYKDVIITIVERTRVARSLCT